MAKEAIASVGNKVIDDFNEKLLNKLSVYAVQLYREKDLNKRYFITSAVVSYVLAHFAEEEVQMRLVDYPNLLPHQDDHILCTSGIVELFKAYRHSNTSEKMILSHLVQYFSQHIYTHDTDYATWITNRKQFYITNLSGD